MSSYAILANPGHNRVYFEQSKALSLAELSLALSALSAEYSQLELTPIAGVRYVTFTTDAPLADAALCTIARLSFVYALFELHGGESEPCLRPLTLPEVLYLDSSISGILKYSGKTNELFTRLLINAALLSTDFSPEGIRLLDPVAGKGTTLFEALSLGFDACGIELSEKAVSEGFTYFKKYLETARFKHSTATEKINLPDKAQSAKRFSVELSRNRDEQKAGLTRRLELVSGSSAYADKYYKKNSFHLIVGDLPYGVQHGNVGVTGRSGSLTRSPKALVSSCAGAWYSILKPGGAMALSWNSFVFSREDFSALLEQNGFRVLRGGVYEQLEHRVDQAIRRDVIVAKK